MCLGIPARIVEKIGDSEAMVELNGVRYRASLILVDDVAEDDYVIVHAGFAIQKIDEEEALETLRIIEEYVLDPEAEVGERV